MNETSRQAMIQLEWLIQELQNRLEAGIKSDIKETIDDIKENIDVIESEMDTL